MHWSRYDKLSAAKNDTTKFSFQEKALLFISLSILNKNAASGIPRSLSFISQGYIEFILNKTFLLAVRAITFTLLHGSPLWISCLRMSVPPPPSPLASLLSTNVFFSDVGDEMFEWLGIILHDRDLLAPQCRHASNQIGLSSCLTPS